MHKQPGVTGPWFWEYPGSLGTGNWLLYGWHWQRLRYPCAQELDYFFRCVCGVKEDPNNTFECIAFLICTLGQNTNYYNLLLQSTTHQSDAITYINVCILTIVIKAPQCFAIQFGSIFIFGSSSTLLSSPGKKSSTLFHSSSSSGVRTLGSLIGTFPSALGETPWRALHEFADKSKPSMSHSSGANCCILIAMSLIWKSSNSVSEVCIAPKCHPVSFSASSLMLWPYFALQQSWPTSMHH